jgi:hypothetical protein
MFSDGKCSTAKSKLTERGDVWLKQKALTIALLFLTSTALLMMPVSMVSGQGGLYIYQITTHENYSTPITSANVGEAVNLIGTLYSANSSYKVYFGDTLVDSNQSSGYYVSSNFTIPEVPSGNYTLTLEDVAIDYNTTSYLVVNTAYIAEAVVPDSPMLLQEGSNVVLDVAITGGDPNTSHTANITVMLPAPLATNFTQFVSLTTGSSGTARAQLTFPAASFQLSGSTTIYTGLYTAYFNRSEGLGESQFLIGITDASQYHKQDTVTIRAVGYQPSQTATLTILNPSGNSVLSQTVTASNQGIITKDWTIPSTATVGDYNVTITSQTTPKAIPDSQIFSIPGYKITINTLNLAGELVPYLDLEAIDQASNTITPGSSGYYGSTLLNLDKGDHTINAYWAEDVKVGEITVSITGDATYNITCQLTNLKIMVQDKNGVPIPSTDLNMTYQYVTTTGVTQTGNGSAQTDLSGSFTFDSALPGINYVVSASKYGVVFNAGNNTISNLPAQPTYQAIIICPEETLTLKTIDYHSAVLPNTHIELIEQESGIFYSSTTDSNGGVSVQVTFGQYRLRVYTADSVLLNETIINVLSNTQSQIRCVLYNLEVSVKVVDYFGNPISNVNVQLSRPSMSTRSATTQGDGTATFSNVIGGNVEITAYPSGNEGAYAAKNIYVDSPTAVQIQMANYAALGPLLMGTSTLATLLIILAVVVLVIALEVFRRTGFKLLRKSEK